jgi:hypothetical protein
VHREGAGLTVTRADLRELRRIQRLQPTALLSAFLRARQAATVFRCERLSCEMPIRDCLENRADLWPSGGPKGKPKRIECVGCPQGEVNALLVPTYRTRPATRPPEVLPPAQRAARARADLERLPVGGGLCPMQEAATLTPDDRGLDHA